MKNKRLARLVFTTALFFSMPLAACGEGAGGGGGLVTLNALSSIEITHEANKKEYLINEAADYTGLEITAHFTKEEDQVIPHSSLEFSGFNSLTAGQKTIDVSYTYRNVTKSVSYTVTVLAETANELVSIEITHAATKTEYQLNEAADYTGLEVTAHYSREADQVIPHNQLTFTGFDSSSEGPKTIYISYTYEGTTKSTSFGITVLAPETNNELVSIEITSPANQLEYALHEEVNYEGLEVTAHFSESEDQVISHDLLVFSGFSSETAGTKTINISYTYKNATKGTSYTVTVFDNTNVTLDFYGFNDRHGVIKDSEYGVGIAKTSTFLKNMTAGQNSLLISSGDMWQGSVESNSNRGVLMTKWMKYMNFTSMTIGNHEFDWGTQYIKNISENYNLPVLGINIIDKTTGKRADYVSPSTVVNRGGAKIGIIGAVGDCYSSISYSQVMDVDFVLDEEYGEKPLTELITAEANRLRTEEGCDFIVYSFHGDSIHTDKNGKIDTYYNIDLSNNHVVDLVFEGHKHIQTSYMDGGGVWHFQSQAESNEQTINHCTVALNTATDNYSLSFDIDNDVYYLNGSSMQSLEEDEGALDLIDEYDFEP